jgi:hypothetical protein
MVAATVAAKVHAAMAAVMAVAVVRTAVANSSLHVPRAIARPKAMAVGVLKAVVAAMPSINLQQVSPMKAALRALPQHSLIRCVPASI